MRALVPSWWLPLALCVPLALAACAGDDPIDQTDLVDTDADADTDTDTDTDADTDPVDADLDGFASDVDCDDDNPDIHPGAPEEDCTDPVDYNCDGEVPLYADADEDGFAACVDCDDTRAAVRPDATEICDGLDNDCDELTDEEDDDLTDAATWFEDRDSDGFGDAAVSTVACEAPAGFVADDTDCDDDERRAFPGNDEVCDTIDNDCDVVVDDSDPDITGQSIWYTDADKDGLGDASSATRACFQPPDTVTDDTDCDDSDADIGGPLTWYRDGDGDGYGDTSTDACAAPTGYVADDGDCDDGDATVNPGAAEVCDRKDNDCDSDVDDDDSDVTGTTDWYLDDDGDGFGDEDDTADAACIAPTDHVDDNTDCDDTDKAVNPDMPFDFDDDVDNDCDSSVDEDVGSETYTHDDDIQPIWNSNCTGCHGSSRPSGGLNLTSSAWSRIVNASSSLSGYDYVEPGLPDDSYLFRKVEGTHRAIGGSGGKMGSLSSSDLSKIETWIEEGAVK